MTHDLHTLLNWKLLAGSHKFPGEDGGTCINEAAVVVAGLEYRAISNAYTCPPCFSIPIAAYTIALNDSMPHELRQKLLIPFVTRLAGTADSTEIEKQRTKLIIVRTATDILPIGLRQCGLHSEAILCEQVTNIATALTALNSVHNTVTSAPISIIASIPATIAYAVKAAEANAIANAASSHVYAFNSTLTSYAVGATNAAHAAATAASLSTSVWATAAAILDAALLIGKQAEPIEVAILSARVEAAKKRATLLSQV